jgi:alginate O-acetyltransferase complex protein AlgJ
MNSNRQIKKNADLILVGSFILALLFPAICSLCRFKKNKAINEYRMLAAFPGLGAGTDSMQIFVKQLDNYFNDHFGGRELLIACNLKIERALFPIEMRSDVLLGREGWLYYLGEGMVDNRLGANQITRQQLKAWQILLEKRRDWLAARGIDYLFVIAPSKESIYPDYLPGWLRQSSSTRLDQFIEYMRVHSTVEILDLRPVLREARNHDPVYYKTDTHWNLMGGFIASEAIIAAISNDFFELKPVVLENFEIKHGKKTGGDLARLAGELTLEDDNLFTIMPKMPMQKLEFHAHGTNIIDRSQFGTIPVPEDISTIISNSQNTAQAIIFGDSFTTALKPFLGYDFGKITFSGRSFDPEIINQEKPTVVINELVERYLNSINPVELLRQESLDIQ